MKALNIYTYSRIEEDMVTKYDNVLAQRSNKLKVKPQEFNAIKTLVELLLECGISIDKFENFFVSYTIEQIGKEFDLLKISKDNLVLNIELKKEDIGEENIQEQLMKNRYYLKHIASDVRSYTFVNDSRKLYRYTGSRVESVKFEELKATLDLFEESLSENVENLFTAKTFLISPLNTTEKFMTGDYFLTNQQLEIKKEIMDLIEKNNMGQILGITGEAGTGKTLLLYDIIKQIAENDIQCCVVHSGILCDGHERLNKQWKNVDIISAKQLNGNGIEILKKYEYVFVDEAHRIYESTFERIIENAILEFKAVIFAYDYG